MQKKCSSLFYLIIIFLFFVSPYGLKAEDKIYNKKKIYNLRLQYRRGLNNCRIENESNYQFTLFAPLKNKFFLFCDNELIFENDNHVSTISEFNISRPFFSENKIIDSIDWVFRVQAETHRKTDLSIGFQWHLHKTYLVEDFLKSLKIKCFVQFLPYKTTEERGKSDIYIYYSFPLIKDIVYTRGFGRWFFEDRLDKEDFKMIAQDVIVPLTDKWDVYLRYSHYNQNRNTGFGAGIRYLIKF